MEQQPRAPGSSWQLLRHPSAIGGPEEQRLCDKNCPNDKSSPSLTVRHDSTGGATACVSLEHPAKVFESADHRMVDRTMGQKVEGQKSLVRPVGKTASLPLVQNAEQGASVCRVLSPPGLGFFGEPLWSASQVLPRGPFETSYPKEAGGESASTVPLPPALFLQVALFLGAEDVGVLSSVCRSLRWIAFNRTIWQSLCFSEELVTHLASSAVQAGRFGGKVTGKCATHLAEPHCFPHRRKEAPLGTTTTSNNGESCSGPCFQCPRWQALKYSSGATALDKVQSTSFSSNSGVIFGGKAERRVGAGSSSESVKLLFSQLEPNFCKESKVDGGSKLGIHCRGLQAVPGHTLDELVDWRFVYILNQVSPGPRIYIRVRDMKIQLPLHPVIPSSTQTQPAVGVEASGGETYSCGPQEQDLQLVRWGTGMMRLSPQEYISKFVRRALNICRPMRLRHLRPGDRPGLCVGEILRDQSYLLEWQVPLQCLLESSSQQSSAVDCCNESTSSLVWPLPPYGMPEGSSPIGGEHEGWYMENGTIYSLADNSRTVPLMEAPDTDANDRLFSGVLDRGSAFATLLSPLSYRTTAVAIVVSAVLVAVATASATAALTTAAAATATLAARHSRIFRVDLHVIERDEHEDDQDGALECDGSPSRLVPTFSGARTSAASTPTSSFDCCDQVANEPLVGGRVGVEAATSSEVRRDGEPFAQRIKPGPLLPYLRRVFVARMGQFLRSSTLASLALTEASFSSAASVLSTISRGAITTASSALAAASSSFNAVLLPPVTAICVATGSGQQHSNLILWVRKAGGEWLRHRAVQLTAPLGLQYNAEVRGDAKVLLEKTDGAKFCLVQSLQRDSVEEAKGKQRQLRHALLNNQRRLHVSESSAFVSPSPTAHDAVRRSQSILPPYIGKLGTFEQQGGWSMVKADVRSLDCCDSLSSSRFTLNSGPVEHGLPTEVDEASILIRSQGEGSISPRFYTGQKRGASPRTSGSGGVCDEDCRNEQLQEGSVDWLPTPISDAPEQDLGVRPSGSPLSSACRQPCHGLLLFVSTCLPRGIDMAWPHGDAHCCGSAAEWEALAATSRMAPPEDVPLLLPTDATASDLVRLLFLTLVERNYVLPVVSSKHARTNIDQSDSREAVSRSLHDCRGSRRSRSSSPTSSPRQNLLRFWFGATQLSGGHIVDQPLPSAKLIADLRLMSCERLSLTVLPFSTESVAGAANARCLTLSCLPSDSVQQLKGTRLQGSRGLERMQTYRAFHGHRDAGSQPVRGVYGTLLPRSARAQNGRLAVVTSTPQEGEPVLILRREASLSFQNRLSDSHTLSGKQEGHRLSSRGSPTFLQRDAQDVHCASCGARETLALPLSDSPIPDISQLAELSKSLGQGEAGAVPRRPRQIVQELRSSAPHNPFSFGIAGGTCSSTSCARPEGILESSESVSRPWILRSSLNTRQFEYHPQRTNIMLTGGNDGTVRVLDWEKDVILGTKLVDSHQILGLSWFKHHPELFVCASGVSGIPYVVRWREQEDCLLSSKGDRSRVHRAVMPSSTALPLFSEDFKQPGLQQRSTETTDFEAGQWDRYAWGHEDFVDNSTMAAALTWFWRYGRGGRISNGGKEPLRIVHQYCACEDLSSVSVNCTDDYLLVSGGSPDIAIHDIATGTKLGTLEGLHAGSINIVRFAHTSPHLFVTASFDQTCRLWDLRQRNNGHQPLLNVATGSLSVMCCFDDSDQWLLCSGVDAALRQVCLRSSDVYPESFAIPPVNAETNFRRAVYLQGGREFITAGTEEGFFRVFSRGGRDMGVVSLEGMLRPFTRLRAPQSVPILPILACDLLNLRVQLRSHVALGLSAVGDAAMATAAGVSLSSVALALRSAFRHLGGRPAEIVGSSEVLTRVNRVVRNPRVGHCLSPPTRLHSPVDIFEVDSAERASEGPSVEEYVQSLRAHPQERQLVGVLLGAKDRVETDNGQLSLVAMSRLPPNMLA